MTDKLIAVTRTSKGGSALRITLPKEIAEKMDVSESEHIGFYEVKPQLINLYITCSDRYQAFLQVPSTFSLSRS